ncbi:maturation protein [ssRNA phage SRR6960799_41]|uniref:Maturation protein n=1 Tax=ssRNA phage SRR6960799_41 TaxID=2786600 RepID=A0A8S5L530_9VIRU|nr:maturation protein [ssRNA phage SRR6960799_41]DAD52306.1 TPA_asm: maturation protein [ssRNA phage SRR6960799_41]
MSRVRTILPVPSQGTITYPDNPALNSTYDTWPAGYAKCVDERLPGQGYNLEILKVKSRTGGLVNGPGPKANSRKFANYQFAYVRSSGPSIGIFTTNFSPSIPSDAVIATDMAARTNPSRADIDLPVFIAELKDVPELIFDFGKSIVKAANKANLTLQFGWAPLLSDLNAMLHFVSLTEARLAELKRLRKSGLRRKRQFGTYTSHETTSWPWDSASQLSIPSKTYITRRCKVWAYCKWKPTLDMPKTDAELLSLARKAVYGMTIDGVTMWELIPWSWLVDWFSTVGAYTVATRNIVPCALSGNVLIMKHFEYMVRGDFLNFDTLNPGYSVSPFIEVGERKLRTSSAPTPYAARLPFLSVRQLSIISSLYVMRSRLRLL